MRCHVCGTETVQPDQKFCIECGARLTGADTATPTVPLRPPSEHPMFDPITGQLLAVPSAPLPPPQFPAPAATPAVSESDPTAVLPTFSDPTSSGTPMGSPAPASRTGPIAATYDRTGVLPANYAPYPVTYDDEPGWGWNTGEVEAEPAPSRGFRVKPLFVLAVLAGALTIATTWNTVISGPPDSAGNTGFRVNDFGTNLMVAGILLGVTMILGGIAWCFGFRWGAGLVAGAGLGTAGWVALVLAQTELVLSLPSGNPSREVGYWLLVGAAGAGVLVTIVSLRSAGDDGRAGLDPWVAALGAIAAVVAFVGPLIPLNGARIDLNWTSAAGGPDIPTLYFVGRLLNIVVMLVTGVFGFLLVRRYGLGLAIGGLVGIGWLTLTAALEWTDSPVGPAFNNPGATSPVPYIVTTAGIALTAFFALVATAMAAIDRD